VGEPTTWRASDGALITPTSSEQQRGAVEPTDVARGEPTNAATAPLPANARIVIISASLGARHDGPADELGRRLSRQGWWVDRPDALAMLPDGVGRALRLLHHATVRRTPSSWGPVLDPGANGPGGRAARAWLDGLIERTAALVGDAPHAVVATHPVISGLLARLRGSGGLDAPVISLLTDPWVDPSWWHPAVDLVLAPHPAMEDQLRRLARSTPGARTQVVPTAMALPPAVADARRRHDVAAVRAELGVPPDRTLALVTAGSRGTGPVDRTAADLARQGAWPVVLCARNDRLRRRVESVGVGRALGWVDDVPRLLAAADVVVHNTGGLACWEALAARRPVVSYRVLPGRGAANAAALQAAGAAPWARSPEDLGVLVDQVIRDRDSCRLPPRTARVDPAWVVHQAALGRCCEVVSAARSR
jgi:processive 1,2-diacylglycerol beta-glucosyltransferase